LDNREILVVGYGSLLSGYGLLAERRGGASRLVASDVAPVSIRNARRGLAKPSSHGRYLAMDIEPVDRAAPISASIGSGGAAIGGLKVVTANGWFAARPSGTESVYKLYAESFLGEDHLRRIQKEARELIAQTFAGGA